MFFCFNTNTEKKMVNLNEVISDGIKPRKIVKKERVLKEFNIYKIPSNLIKSTYEPETKSPSEKPGRIALPKEVYPSPWFG